MGKFLKESTLTKCLSLYILELFESADVSESDSGAVFCYRSYPSRKIGINFTTTPLFFEAGFEKRRGNLNECKSQGGPNL